MKKIKEFNESQSKSLETSMKYDTLSHVLGEDRHGRVKGLGLGVTVSKLKAQAHTNKVVLSLEEKRRKKEARLDMFLEGNHRSLGNERSPEVDTPMIKEEGEGAYQFRNETQMNSRRSTSEREEILPNQLDHQVLEWLSQLPTSPPPPPLLLGKP